MKKALIIISVVLIVLFLVVLFAVKTLSGISGKSAASIDKASILSVNLSKPYPERSTYNFSGFSFKKDSNFLSLIKTIETAAEDEDIIALSLKINGVSLSRSQLDEFSKAVEEFKDSGKPVYAFMPSAGMKGLLASSLADSVFMPPPSDFILLGMAIMPMFYAGTAEKVGVGFDVIQIGDYKGAAEMFTQKGFTPPLRENYTSLLDDLYQNWIVKVAQRRDITQEQLRAIVDKGTFEAEEGFEIGLIDGILYPQEYKDKMLSLVEDNDERIVSVSRYKSSKSFLSGKQKIAVIYCLGNIHSGESKDNPFKSNFSIGDETFMEAIDDAADDDNIEAIVLRVNSPGGSALASDFLWKSIIDAKEKKPVLVSMGGVAASGGYYISMPADSIFCSEGTITGSIGVIFMKFNIEELMTKVGITVDTITRGSLADDFSLHKPMDPEAYDAFRRSTLAIYSDFTSKAAAGRGLELDSLLKLAEGRIWTGNQAVANHLADRIASLSEVIDIAANMVSIPEEELGIVVYPKEKSFFKMAFEIYSGSAVGKLELPKEIENAFQPYIDLVSLYRYPEPLTLMPVRVIEGEN
ncbi:signal peptide peptidase SppA [bacterium]|nr:signal peptide peptidase SppA [bacterium]